MNDEEVVLLSQTDTGLEKNLGTVELTKVIVLPNDPKIISDSVKTFNPQSYIESISNKSTRFISPRQMIKTRRDVEFNRAKSIALNMHHTLIVK